jgi:hypothetical protein
VSIFLVAVSCLGRWRGPPFFVIPRKAEVLFHFLLPTSFRKQKLNGAAGIPFYCTYFAHYHILICFLCTSTRRMAGLCLCGLMPTFFFFTNSLHSVLHDLLLLDIIFPLQTQKRYTVEKTTLIHEMSIRYHTNYSNDTPHKPMSSHVHTF